MDVYIKFDGNITDEVSYDLIQLGDILEQECDVSIKFDKQGIKPGVKDSGFVIGMTIAGLVLSGIQTVISAISYWESKQPKYSISISVGNNKYYYSNIEAEKVDRVLSEIRQLPNDITEKIEIKISKK